MSVEELFEDKSIRAKQKSKTLAAWLGDGKIDLAVLLEFARTQSEKDLAICLEALEIATKDSADSIGKEIWSFLDASLKKGSAERKDGGRARLLRILSGTSLKIAW